MENKILEDLKDKLKTLQSKINSKNNKIEKKNEEIKYEKNEIQRVEATRKGDDPKFEAFNEMVDADIKNKNKDILRKEKEVQQEKENIVKLEEEKKTSIQEAKSQVKKDSSKKLVQIKKLNDKVKGLKESARKVKQSKLATTDKTVYKVNDGEHKLKIEEIKKVYKEKNTLYKEYQENQKALDEIEKIEEEVLGKSEPAKSEPAKSEPAKTAQGEPEQNEPEQVEQIQNEPEQNEPEQVEQIQNEPEQNEPEQVEQIQEEPEQNEPEQVEQIQEEPEQNEPEQVEQIQEEPEQNEPEQTDYIDMYLLVLAAKKRNVDSLEYLEEIENYAKHYGVTPQEMLENIAQRMDIIPMKIRSIYIENDEYAIEFGNEKIIPNQIKYFNIGSDEKDIKIDRKSQAELRKVLISKYPLQEKAIKKCDIGLLKILDENNMDLDENLKNYANVDYCEKYIESMEEEKKVDEMPDITYDVTYATSLEARDVFARNNARNAKAIATEIVGLSKNPIIRVYDFIQEKYESIANWFGEKVLAIGDGRNKENADEEVIDSQDQNDLTQGNNEPSFKEGIYNKKAAERVVEVGNSARIAQENAEVVITDNNVKSQENDGEEITNE